VDGEEWNRILRHQPNVVLLDVRNGYEWDVGRFKGAKRPQVTKFKHFSHIADELESFHDKSNTSVLMYCTGGIRCEVFSSLMKSKGWQDVKQLEGGVLGYSTTEDTDQWEGNLFVFDDRLVVPIDGKVGGSKDIPVARCIYCGVLAEMCFNCNNKKCNKVFVSCLPCAKTHLACCSPECRDSADDHFIARNRRQVEGVGRGQHYRDTIHSLNSHHRPLLGWKL